MSGMAICSTQAEGYDISGAASSAIAVPAPLSDETSALLIRMFRDPRVLKPGERSELVAQLREAVELYPQVPEVRVLLGMVLCVDLQPQEAMEQLRQATQQAPDCFVARLKFGELLMRLRVCGQAAEETQMAAQLAANVVQSELARKQAATIRTMLREGVERGGYKGMMARLLPFRRKAQTEALPVLASSR